MAKKIPQPELCASCTLREESGACRHFGRDMSTNEQGQPWRNWRCQRRKAIIPVA